MVGLENLCAIKYQGAMLKKLDAWLEQQLHYPGDNAESLALKKRFWIYVAPSPVLLGLFSIFLWFFHLRLLAISMLIFCGLELIVVGWFTLIHRQVDRFALVHQYFYLAYSFAAVLFFGGILHSAGMVFIGLAGALQAIFFFKPKQIRYIFLIYIFSVLLEAFLQPFLTPVPEITPKVNLILFVSHFLVVASVINMVLKDFVLQSLRIKELEAERLRELDIMKTRFYTNITHEFRTPLTVILGMASQIREKPRKFFNAGLQLIQQNGTRLLHLVNQMLDLSKLEAGSLPLNFVQSDILPFLYQIVEPFQHLAEKKKIRFHILTDLEEMIMDFDPDRTESLVVNLLSNAIKYSPADSDIYVMVAQVSGPIIKSASSYSPFTEDENIGINAPDKKLEIKIKDSGYGISDEELPSIFNRFYQGKDPKSNQEGSGIGLVIVKELVHLLKGDLFVKSITGKGTEFSIYLPVTNQANLKDISREPFQTGSDTFLQNGDPLNWIPHKHLPHLLIIEDNIDVAAYIKSVLETQYQLEVAIDGESGIKMAIENLPDAIVSDVMMPEKDGFEVCDTLKKDFRTSHIPIILLTAKADREALISGYEHGADAYLTKPFDPQELIIRLRNLLEIREKLKTKYRLLASKPLTKTETPTSPDEVFLNKIWHVLEENYSDENFDASRLTQKTGLSRVQLFRKLKALTGVSASHLIRSYRLNKAKDYIINTSLNISEVGYEVGFKDPAYFTRAFTKTFGFAPSSLRRQQS